MSLDADLIAKKLVIVEANVADLRRFAKPELIEADPVQRGFVEHSLQVAIQAVLDVATHIVSAERLGMPARNRDFFKLIARTGWMPSEQVETLEKMVGFRNIIVHGYEVVDLKRVRTILEHGLEDLLRFVQAIRTKLGGAR